MTQTVSALSGGQSLYTHQSVLSAVRKDVDNSRNYVNTYFTGNELHQKPTVFYYKESARLQFAVTDSLSPHFILIKGLIEFNRSREMKFTFDRDKKAFTVDLAVAQLEELNKMISRVYELVLSELRFKAALRRAIQFEARYKAEAVQVYNFANS